MKTTTNTRKPESERARKLREGQEKRHLETLAQIAQALEGSTAARVALALQIGRAITYHESGKIEGIFSLDTACSNNDFCPRMQATEAPEVICKYCYTRNLWDSSTRAHHITGEILSKIEFTAEEAALIPVPGLTVRFNSDGEIINLTHAVNLLRIAATHPAVTFTVWTKRPAILDQAIRQEGKPANLICGVSSPMINTPFRERWTWVDFIFTVYTPEGMRRALARGEVECNGRKCLECGFHCYRIRRSENAGPVYVAEALRKPGEISSKAWPGVVASIDAATLDRQPAEA